MLAGAVLSLVLTVVASALPWGTLTLVGGVSASTTGFEGGDGTLTVVLAGLALVGAILSLTLRSRLYAGISGLGAGVLVLAVFTVDYVDVSGKADDLPAVQGSEVGPGLWLTLVAGLALVATGLTALLAGRDRDPPPPPR